jgi:hypothetical protein
MFKTEIKMTINRDDHKKKRLTGFFYVLTPRTCLFDSEIYVLTFLKIYNSTGPCEQNEYRVNIRKSNPK